MNNHPPSIFLRFFRWFCHPELVDSIEGDLMELYKEREQEKGKRKADLAFIRDVLLLFRPGIIRSFQPHTPTNPLIMFSSYFKVGWRNLIKQKGYALINIGGLAMGMAAALLIGLWVHDEFTFNTYHDNYKSIGKVYRHNTFPEYKSTNVFTVTGLGTLLQSEYGSNFKHVVLVRGSADHRVLQYGDTRFTEQGMLMQSGGPEMLTLKMIHGTRKGLEDKNSIMLSASVANKLFHGENPVNKVIQVDAKYDMKVTGVYEDLPKNSEFSEAAYLAPLELYFNGTMDLNVWDNYNVNIYVQLEEGHSFERVSETIKDAMLPHVDERTAETKPEIFLVPMSEWHLNAYFKNGERLTSPKMRSVWYFIIIGGFILLLACINFMNLSTARSERRAKEVGIRKSIGSVRSQLIYQFFSESLLVAILSFVVAVALVQLTLPMFNSIADKDMSLPWSNLQFWGMGIAFTLFTGILAGSYPALYLSSFNPVKVLKGTFKTGRFSSLPRKVLVVVQFAVSVILIVATAIVYKQIQYGKDRPVGYTREGLLALRLGPPENRGNLDAIRNELLRTGMVKEIGEANYEITSSLGWNDSFAWKNRDENIFELNFNTIYVTYGYGEAVGLEFVNGHDFSRELATDGAGIVINETAAKNLGVEDPVGEVIMWDRGDGREEFTILGVTKDMVKGSPFEPAFPTMLFLSSRSLEFLYIRINPNVSTHEALPKIEKAFTALMPDIPFDYTFADEDYDAKFKSEERVGKLAAIFSVLAIAISCLGLLGLASFTAAQRTKEIGIRKVLGASVTNIWSMLSGEFVWLVLIACAIALPTAYWFMSGWLENYKIRTDIPWYVFVYSGAGALVVTLATVSFQAIKAGVSNPVKSLRSE